MDNEDIALEIITELQDRRQKGLKQYGRPVTSEDGIDWLKHAEEEALDLATYLRAAQKRMRSLEAEVARLESLLMPLVRAASALRDRSDDSGLYVLDKDDSGSGVTFAEIEVGDLRRAAEALTGGRK